MSLKLLLLSLTIASIALGACSQATPGVVTPVRRAPPPPPPPVATPPVTVPTTATPVETVPTTAAPVDVAPVTTPVTVTEPVTVVEPVSPTPVTVEPVSVPTTTPVAATPVAEPVPAVTPVTPEPTTAPVTVEPTSMPIVEPVSPTPVPVSEPTTPVEPTIPTEPLSVEPTVPIVPVEPTTLPPIMTPSSLVPSNDCKGDKPTGVNVDWVCASGAWSYEGTVTLVKESQLAFASNVAIYGDLVIGAEAKLVQYAPKTTLTVHGCVTMDYGLSLYLDNEDKKFESLSTKEFEAWVAVQQTATCTSSLATATVTLVQASSGCKRIERTTSVVGTTSGLLVAVKLSNYNCNVIIGVAVGLSVLVVLLIIALIVICVKQHRKRARVTNGGFPESPLLGGRR